MTASLDVARDFSKFPAGRAISDGPFSGEGLRKLLAAYLRDGDLIVLLDGGMGYGSGFLEEAFGGLVRECGFAVVDLRKKLRLESSEQELLDEIWSYVEDAGRRKPIHVQHASLEKVLDESPFRTKCPVCPKGVLLVSRNQQTMGLAREDCCTSCGQLFTYTDKDINGVPLEPERTQTS